MKTNDEGKTGITSHEEGRLEITPNGEQILWFPDTNNESGGECACLVFRGPDAVSEEYRQLSDYVWYARHQHRQWKMNNSEITLNTAENIHIHKTATAAAKKIEQKYGLNYLQCDEIEHFIRLGKMSALAWVLGSTWEESFDT